MAKEPPAGDESGKQDGKQQEAAESSADAERRKSDNPREARRNELEARMLKEIKEKQDERLKRRSDLPKDREKHQEAVQFRKDFEEIMCKEDNIELLENFMAESDEYSRFVWLDLLLSSPSHNTSGNNSIGTAFVSLMWSCLIKYFPDVLQRELFLDGFVWIDSEDEIGERLGALHGAVLCGRPEIVQLLSDHRTNAKVVGKAICRPLNSFLDDHERAEFSVDCFESIKRALLWTFLPNPIVYDKVAWCLRELEEARQIYISDTQVRNLQSLIDLIGIEKEWEILLWTAILGWASAIGRSHVIDEFKNCRPHLTDCEPWKPFFVKRTNTDSRRELVEEIVKIIDRMMTDVEELKILAIAQCDMFLQVCSLYNLACRVPPLFTTSNRSRSRSPNIRDNSRWTAVHLAAALGDHSVLDALIKSYDLVLNTLPENWTIELKSKSSSAGGNGETDTSLSPTVELFLRDSFRDSLLMTPLHHAILGNHHVVTKTLLQWNFFGLHLNDMDIFKRTACQMACSDRSRLPILQELMSTPGLNTTGIDTNTEDCCAFSPLHWAVYVGGTEAVRVLVSHAKSKGIRTMAKSIEGLRPYRVAEDLDPEVKKDIQDLLESIREVKDSVDRVYRDRQVYVDAANALLVGAALIASVTFGGWLQPPLGDGHESTHTKVRMFWVFNSLSFFFAVGTVVAGAEAVLPQADVYIEDAVESIRRWLVVIAFLFPLSIVFVLGAFATAGFSSLSLVHHLKVNMEISTIIGGTVCALLLVTFCRRLLKISRVQNKEKEPAMQRIFKAWLKNGASLNSQSLTSIRASIQLVWDLRFAWTSKEFRDGGDKASLDLVRRYFRAEPGAEPDERYYSKLGKKADWNDLRGKVREHLHPPRGQKNLCHVRRCYRDLALESKVCDEWYNKNIVLPQNTDMWKRILQKLENMAKSEPSKHFLFQDWGTNPGLEKYGTKRFLELEAVRKHTESPNLEKYGIRKVEKEVDVVREQLKTLNRRAQEDLAKDYEAGSFGGDARFATDPGYRGVRRINDSLYELYAPEGVAKVDVIFFHGLQARDYRDAYWKTWSSDGTTSTLWPRTLLAEKSLPQARILAVSYDSSARESWHLGGQLDLWVIAESLVYDIIASEAASVGQGQRPILLVGHSLGGMVIKSFILTAQYRADRDDLDDKVTNQSATIRTIDNFLHNLRGVFYYATPHQGSALADVASKLPGNSDVLISLKTLLSKEIARLNEDFRTWRAGHKIMAYTIGEGLPTQLGRVWVPVIVTEASARADTDSFKTAFRDDHISICKPKSTTSDSFQFLLEFIKRTVPEEESIDISMKESLL